MEFYRSLWRRSGFAHSQMSIWSCPQMSPVAIFSGINASDGGTWYHPLKISVSGAILVHLNFSTGVFHKSH